MSSAIIMYLHFFSLFLFHSLSSVSGMSCAGTLGTCTHGTGKDYGLIANFVSLQQPQKKKKKKRKKETLDRASGKVQGCKGAMLLYQPKIALFRTIWFLPDFSALFACS